MSRQNKAMRVQAVAKASTQSRKAKKLAKLANR
jgi:hypothetical protein